MEPGCFCSCLNRNEDAFVKELDISRATKKRMIQILRHDKRLTFNPENHNRFGLQCVEHSTEHNSSLLYHIQPIKLAANGLNQYPYPQIDSHPSLKTYRHDQNTTLLQESTLLNSARSAKKSRERPRRPSSLYGGAKGIIKRMSLLDEQVQSELLEKTQAFRQQKISQNSLSIKEHITLRNSFRWLNDSENTSNDGDDPFQAITIPQIASDFNLPKQPSRTLRVGKILGRGKYSHTYLSQDVNTQCLVTTKYIFKKGLLPNFLSSIKDSIHFLTKVNHPLILDCYGCSEDEQKITIVGQYTLSLLYDQINFCRKFTLAAVRQSLKQIIEAIIIMHESNRAHGNLSPVQIGYTLEVCKLRMSLTNPSSSKEQYIKDIHAIGLIGYEMAYGVIKNIDRLSPLRDELAYYSSQNVREKIIEQLQTKRMSDEAYKSLNQFLLNLLSQNDNIRLCASNTLTHPFFLAIGE